MEEIETQEIVDAVQTDIDDEQSSKIYNQIIMNTLTDLGNAERFIKGHGAIIRYCTDQKRWYVYQNGRWVMDNGTNINRMGHATIREISFEAEREGLSTSEKVEIQKHAAKSASKGRIKAMIDLAKWFPGIVVSSSAFDQNPWLLNCCNGTLDLMNMELKPHDPEDFITKMVDAPYESDAICPVWDAFISRVMNRDQEKICFIQRIVGYALTGVTPEQCLFVLHGPGANGKSTFTEVLRELLGDYAMHTTTSSLLTSSSSPIRNDLARLNSVRFVSAAEIGMGKKLNEALVKQLTGGDQVTARFLYNEYFEYKPRFKLFIAANHKPEIRGIDHGIWRRIHMVPFDVSIPADEIDKDLLNKLKEELPGILAWAVRGCIEWRNNGLGVPAAIRAATLEYRKEMDLIAGFIEDKCILDASSRVTLGELYEAYRGWTDEACQDPAGKKIFGNLMRQKGFAQSKSGSSRYWEGIKLAELKQG